MQAIRYAFLLCLLLVPFANASAPTSPWTTGQIEEFNFFKSIGDVAGSTQNAARCDPTGFQTDFTTINGKEYVLGFSVTSWNVGDVQLRGSVSGTLFLVDGQGTNPPIITSVKAGTDPSIVDWSPSATNPYRLVYFKSIAAEQLSFVCPNDGANGNDLQVPVSGADTLWFNECKSAYGCITIRKTGSPGPVAFMFDLSLVPITETIATATIGNNDNEKTDGIAWVRLNDKRTFATTTLTTNGITSTTPRAQSFVDLTSVPGRYIEQVEFYVGGAGSNNCLETMSVILQTALSFPHQSSNELLNWTFQAQTTTTQTTGFAVHLNLITGEVFPTSATMGLVGGFGTQTQFGLSLGSDNLPIDLQNRGTLYMRIHHSADCFRTIPGTSDQYAGGSEWTLVDTNWTATANDLGYFKLWKYGNEVHSFKANMTAIYPGGAYYTYIYEEKRDKLNDQYLLTGWQGEALIASDSFQLAGTGPNCTLNTVKACFISEQRLGYIELPFNSTLTRSITLDTKPSGRNLFYTGTPNNILAQSSKSPSTPFAHAAIVHFDNQFGVAPNLQAIAYFADDGFFFNLNVSIVLCEATDQAGACTKLTTTKLENVGYIAQIKGGRQIVGVSATNGFSLNGQDLRSSEIVISLSKTGYSQIDFTVNIPTSGGYYELTTWMALASINSDLSARTKGAGAITCEPDPQSKVVPCKANFTTSNPGPETAFYTFFRFDPGTGFPVVISETYPFVPGTAYIEYPVGRASEAANGRNDTGRYSLVFTTGEALILQTCNFAINTNQTNFIAAPPDATSLAIMTSTLGTQVAEVALQNIVSTKDRARDYALTFAQWAWDDPILIPNMWLVLLACMVISIFSLGARRNGG